MLISKIFPSKYVKAADLQGRPFIVTISRLILEDMGHGAEKERKPVLYFENASKGLVLNRTNAMIIAALYGDETDQWRGQRITIYPTKVRAFGAMQDAIRVRDQVPLPPKPQPATQHVEESVLDDPEDMLDDTETMNGADMFDGDALFRTEAA
jgi:hypothetical protein